MEKDNENEILETFEPASCFDLKKTRGRPQKVLNGTGIRVIIALAARNCPKEAIASELDVKIDTLTAAHNKEAFLAAYKKGQDRAKRTISEYQMDLARVNATMAIWLGKQLLGQRAHPEEIEQKEKVNVTINLTDTSKEGNIE